MEGIGEIQAGFVIALRCRDACPILGGDAWLAEEDSQDERALDSVGAAKHPFQFQQDGLGNENFLMTE